MNWWTKIPQKVQLTPNFKNDVNLHQHITCSKLRPSSDCLCLFGYMWNIVEKKGLSSMLFSAAPKNPICKVMWSISEDWYQTFNFLSKVMQKRYKLDLAIIRFSAYDNLLPLHTNKSTFFTIRSTARSRPSSFFSKNSEEVIIFQQLTNQTSPEVSIVTKFQESRKFTSTYYMFQITACQRMFVSRWLYVK